MTPAHSHLFDRERLQVRKGDEFDFEGTRYVADEIGLRWLIGHKKDDPRILAMVRRLQVTKMFPENEDEPHIEPRQPLPLVPKR